MSSTSHQVSKEQAEVPLDPPTNNSNANANHSQPKGRLAVKLLLLGSILHLLFALYSLLVVRWRPPYAGPLLPHLPIHSGEFLYARTPRENWEHRILMLKAMGLNTLSTYVVWNFHELRKGEFDFQNGERNLTALLALAQKHQMKVMIRPGPYICAEWDFGGLPARLLGVEGLAIRTTDPVYEAEVRVYFAAVAQVIRPFLHAKGGPIILLQIENEFGYVSESSDHSLNLLRMWEELQIECEFSIEDAGELWKRNYWPGAHVAVSQTSGLLKYLQLDLSPVLDPDSLVIGGEVYAGWFTDWGEDGWQRKSPQSFSAHINRMLSHNRSINVYVAIGGTNFATAAGANGFNPFYDYIPHVTSYDEDSPVTEHGRPTLKYHMLREVFQNYHGEGVVLPPIPDSPLPMAVVSDIFIERGGTLFDNLPPPAIKNGSLTFFESDILQMYNQGLVLYEATLTQARRYSFQLVVRDFAVVFINDSFLQTLTRGITEQQKISFKCLAAPCKLRVVVEAMGHINFGKGQGRDRKGLVSFTQNSAKAVEYRWDIYKFGLDNIPANWTNVTTSGPVFPTIFRGTITVETVGDTFLDMRGWGKGFLWINGHNLGRFWAIGPQYRLYCPGVWLRKGKNQISVLQLTGHHTNITAFDSMI